MLPVEIIFHVVFRQSPLDRIGQTHSLLKEVDAIFDAYFGVSWIQHSSSRWASLIVVVAKRDENIRITVNHKRLNSVTAVGKISVPRIDYVP